ncbi:TPA: lipopolysaccharide biosynthesis protein [Vibrio parahaemolyticus]
MFNKIMSFSLGPVLSVVVGIATVPILSWYFKPEDLGQMNLFITLMAGATNIFVLGLDQAYVRFYESSKNRKSLFITCMLPQVIFLSVVTLIIVTFEGSYNLIGRIFLIDSVFLKSIIICSFWLVLFIRMLSLIPRMEGCGYKFSLIQVVRKISVLMSIPIIILYFIDIEGKAILLQSVSIFITSLFAFYFAIGCLNKRELWSLLPSNDRNNIYIYGKPLILSGVIFWVLISMDRISLRFFHGISELGVYSVAISLSAFMTVFQSIFSTLWSPIGYKWFENNSVSSFKLKFKVASKFVVQFTSVLMLLYLVFSDLAVFILPPQYHESIGISKLLVLYPYFYIISEVSGIGINLEKKTKYLAQIMLACGAVNLSLNFLLTPKFGSLGASLAIALTFCLYMTLKSSVSARLGHAYISISSYLIILAVFILCMLDVVYGGYAFKCLSVFIVIYILFMIFKSKSDFEVVRDGNA